ncbi:ABC transporter permease [Paenibacillus farraposensis]|uniref:Transport permease protein n=1 Tax=Paenibacillus farraposensis TaxID=2807095 RepID=A0ABW4DGJ8_9BACL|nr:ABC transporter permease [Paenibacillus farraposensis]MCC3378383.1 ABC transporter permease [Paenibacillus farraposensis]
MNLTQNLSKNLKLLWELSKKDIKSRYLGSFMGVLWAFIHPMVSILVYWVVFQVGFKNTPIGDTPFILWLLTGMVPWLFISESLSTATYSIIENNYLVKKIVFRVSLLPMVKILSALFVHVFFIAVLFIMFKIYHVEFTVYNFQVLYYLLATILLSLSISYITATLAVFVKDVSQIVGVFIQLFFWLTPIFWNLNIVGDKYQFFFKLNPILYIVEGYRDAFINHKWFWEHPLMTIYFWAIVIVAGTIGTKIFKKMKSHFADVL